MAMKTYPERKFTYTFQEEQLAIFESLKNKISSFDMKLCCSESPVSNKFDHFEAHTSLLSAASDILKDMLIQSISWQNPSPIINLVGVYQQDVRYILEYIYKGEVHIPQENAGSFVSACKRLGIKGIGSERQENYLKSAESKLYYNCVFTDPKTGCVMNSGTVSSSPVALKNVKGKSAPKEPKPRNTQVKSNVLNKPVKTSEKKVSKEPQANKDEQNLQIEKTAEGGLCLVCNTAFSLFGNCRAHYIKKHGEEIEGAGRYSCLICENNPAQIALSRFNFQINYKEHLKSKHKINGDLKRVSENGDGSWIAKDEKGGGYCLKCDTYFTLFGNLKAHFNKKHANT